MVTAGTGFSYTEATGDIHRGDRTTAVDNTRFVIEFLGRSVGWHAALCTGHVDNAAAKFESSRGSSPPKFIFSVCRHFPQFASHEFWIAGESYAGIYIPTLATGILQHNEAGLQPNINLQGFMIGNGVSGQNSASGGSRPNVQSFEQTSEGINLRYLKQHAIVSPELYRRALSACASEYAPGISRRTDCTVEIVDPDTVPGDTEGCTQRNGVWRCPLTDVASPHYECCQVLAEAEEKMGL